MTSTKEFALIFDMDGVIVKNHEWHFRAWIEFCHHHGLQLSEEEFYTKIFGCTNHDLLTKLFGNSLTDNDIERMGEEKEALYREIYGPHVVPVPGVVEFIRSARSEGISIALATSAPASNVSFTLEHTGLEGMFEVIVESSQITHSKPHPEIYLKASSLLQLSPDQCVVFEDSLPGIESAGKAGCKVIGVATTLEAERISHADYVIKDFTDTTEIFSAIHLMLGSKNSPK
jgi:beta-phosphoglucomutase family hydrolase